MPIALSETAAAVHFLVLIIINKKYYLIGYSGDLTMPDLSYNIMNLANGHMVAQPGASNKCFFVSYTVAWIYYELFKLRLETQSCDFDFALCSVKVKRALKHGLFMGFTCFRRMGSTQGAF